MNEFTTWSQVLVESIERFGQKTADAIPSVVGSVVILTVGWLIAKLISKGLLKLLLLLKLDQLAERVNMSDYLSRANIQITPSRILSKFVYWLIILLVITTAADSLGWDTVSQEISNLLSFLPRLLTAMVIFIIGLYIASFIRDFIAGASLSLGIGVGKMISSVVFYLMFIMLSLTALNQAGIDTSILSNNMLLILGAILIAGAISYGFASKDILANILAGHFSKKQFVKDMELEVEGIRGTVVERSAISITLLQKDGQAVVIPLHRLISNHVTIIKNPEI